MEKVTIATMYKGRLNLVAYNKATANEMWNMLEPYHRKYKVDITGDACVGDEVVFVQAVFSGSYSRYKTAKFSHYKVVSGKIVNDSYGDRKQQHTFTILHVNGEKTLIKGRNLYKNGLFAKPRKAEEREKELSEKHKRGNYARACREERRARFYDECDEVYDYQRD